MPAWSHFGENGTHLVHRRAGEGEIMTVFDPEEPPAHDRVVACAQALNTAASLGVLRWDDVKEFDRVMWEKLARAAYWSYVKTGKT